MNIVKMTNHEIIIIDTISNEPDTNTNKLLYEIELVDNPKNMNDYKKALNDAEKELDELKIILKKSSTIYDIIKINNELDLNQFKKTIEEQIQIKETEINDLNQKISLMNESANKIEIVNQPNENKLINHIGKSPVFSNYIFFIIFILALPLNVTSFVVGIIGMSNNHNKCFGTNLYLICYGIINLLSILFNLLIYDYKRSRNIKSICRILLETSLSYWMVYGGILLMYDFNDCINTPNDVTLALIAWSYSIIRFISVIISYIIYDKWLCI